MSNPTRPHRVPEARASEQTSSTKSPARLSPDGADGHCQRWLLNLTVPPEHIPTTPPAPRRGFRLFTVDSIPTRARPRSCAVGGRLPTGTTRPQAQTWLALCLRHFDRLNGWEQQFVRSLAVRTRQTPGEARKLSEIADAVRQNGAK
jgi:hypothetical protein